MVEAQRQQAEKEASPIRETLRRTKERVAGYFDRRAALAELKVELAQSVAEKISKYDPLAALEGAVSAISREIGEVRAKYADASGNITSKEGLYEQLNAVMQIDNGDVWYASGLLEKRLGAIYDKVAVGLETGELKQEALETGEKFLEALKNTGKFTAEELRIVKADLDSQTLKEAYRNTLEACWKAGIIAPMGKLADGWYLKVEEALDSGRPKEDQQAGKIAPAETGFDEYAD